MRLYKFIDAQFGLKSLTERRLKISCLDDQNDPFELFADSQIDSAARRRLRDERGKIAREWGMLCFCEDWHSPVLWGHYAEKHRGLCLGFDVNAGDAHKVEYIDERLSPDRLSTHPADHTRPPDFALMKFDAWSYEAERRIWCALDPDGPQKQFEPFGPRLKLAQVYLGARSKVSSAQVRAALQDLAAEVEIVATRIAFRTFAVVRQNAPSLKR